VDHLVAVDAGMVPLHEVLVTLRYDDGWYLVASVSADDYGEKCVG
jgi:hypothetical protein